MKTRKRLVFIVALLLIAGTAGAVTWLKHHKRLGKPGIKATPIPGSVAMEIELPERVLDYTSTNLPEEKIVLDYLPKDTSFARRAYTAPDGFRVDANIILMGLDRTSIHKADYCLAGTGFRVDRKATSMISVGGERAYEFPVAKWLVSRVVEEPGREKRLEHRFYVFWFVADGKTTPSYFRYKCWLMWDMLRTATLQRWAYVSFFAPCSPGAEDATFERLNKLITAAVPEFQLAPSAATPAVATP